jgi:hypothetical protein
MRLGHALVLSRMLLVFFVRKVLSVGALRSPVVRVLLGAGVVLLAVVCSGAAYLFLQPMASDRGVWRLVLETTTVSALLWTQCAFLFVKVLFLNSEGLLELSFHLPLTGRERAVALLVYETVMVLVVASAGLFSIVTATLLVLGPAAVLLLLETIGIPVLATYGLLSLLHVLVVRVLERTRLRRVAQLLGILVVFALMLAYARQLARLVGDTSRRYLEHDTSFGILTAPTWLADRYGAPVLLASAGVALAVLGLAVLALTPQQYVRPSRYLRIWPGRSPRVLLTPYDRCLLRSSQTWLAGLAAGGVFVALCLRPAVHPLWALSLLPMGGLYQYAATEPLRASGWDRSTPRQVYTRLLRAQLLLVAGGALVALLLVGALAPASLPAAGPALGGSLFAVVLTTFVGVMFPAEHDNPFSVFVGLSSTGVVAFVLAAALGVLRLDPTVLAVVLVLLTGVVAAYTVIGITLNEQRRRHEKVAAGPQQPGVRVVADRRRGSGHPAVPHVLDR